MSNTYLSLEPRWEALMRRLGAHSLHRTHFLKLRDQYSGPDRFYHNLDHIESCLQLLDRYEKLADSPESVQLAIWFHDAIYDSHMTDNEAKSAEAFLIFAHHVRLSSKTVILVEKTILSTTHKQESAYDHPDCKLMLDIDLLSLAFPQEKFDADGRNIRMEYRWVPDAVYREERTKILQSFLDRPFIYYTEAIRREHEAQARCNIQHAIMLLSQ